MGEERNIIPANFQVEICCISYGAYDFCKRKKITINIIIILLKSYAIHNSDKTNDFGRQRMLKDQPFNESVDELGNSSN